MDSPGDSRLTFRRRRPSDDAVIVQVGKRAFAEYDLRSAETTGHLARTVTTWVVTRGDQVLGFAMVQVRPPGAELCAIAVAEGERGAGVGASLLRHVVQQLEREGVARLSLHTAEANSAAMDLFLKLGFRRDVRLPRYYRGVFDAWVMSLPLAPARA